MGLIHKGPCKRETGKPESEGVVMTEVEGRVMGPRAKGCRQCLEVGKGKEISSSLESPKAMQPSQPILNV